MDVRNRVQEVRRVRFGDVQAHPHNFRRHPQNQRKALEGVVGEVGFASVPLAYHSERNGGALTWLDGHLRSEAFPEHEGEIAILDVNDAEAALLLATLDPLAALATHDAEALDALLRDVQTSDAAVQQMLADVAKEAGLYQDVPTEDTEPQVDRAEELRVKWGVESGQLWRLGTHRIICGDCTDVAVVARVMGGEKANAVVTDPPYGINREGIQNDDPEGLRALFDGCLAALPCTDAVVIAFQSPRLEWVWLDAARVAGHKPERLLWMYRTGQAAYPWRGWYMRSDAIRVCSVGRPVWAEYPEAATDCYTVNINDAESVKASAVGGASLHSTVKPVDVLANLVEHTTGIVYDPFLGSGTTIIACENLKRRCYAVEISPAYVAVALERWATHTGRTPELIP